MPALFHRYEGSGIYKKIIITHKIAVHCWRFSSAESGFETNTISVDVYENFEGIADEISSVEDRNIDYNNCPMSVAKTISVMSQTDVHGQNLIKNCS